MAISESVATRTTPDARYDSLVHETKHTNGSLSNGVPSHLPPGSSLEAIAFVPSNSPESEVLLKFPSPLQRMAVVVDRTENPEQAVNLEFLSVPSDRVDDEELLAEIRAWVDAAAARSGETTLVMTFQHVQVLWSPERVAVIAQRDRLPAVRNSLVEVTHYIAELAAVERELAVIWPELEEDLPLTFKYDKFANRNRSRLEQRFVQVYKLRSRLSRVTPYLLSPHLYPPTLASQIGERLRERTRVELREEFVSDQLEVCEDVYDTCGQRANDYKHARTNNTLEWIIILLLLSQMILALVQYLPLAFFAVQ